MTDYIYDGSFDGLLTVIWHHYYTDRAARICTPENFQPSFLQDSVEVETDSVKADKVYQAIRYKISEYDLRSVYRAWLSCDPEKEMKILRYVVLGFRERHRTSSLHGNPVVADFQGILQKISKESERMLQFVRFSVIREATGGAEITAATTKVEATSETEVASETTSKTGVEATANTVDEATSEATTEPPAGTTFPAYREIMYARVEPDNDVIELAAKHFCDRFHQESFIIHDVGRDKAVIASRGRWVISAFAPEQAPDTSADERQIRQLWKQYYDHIAIMERKNTRCQNNFLPDRYRKHLTEIITADL